MEHRTGETSPKYECMECGAGFSKHSLLQEHKRILGHKDIFICGVCDKVFYRKDNLDIHAQKHDSEDIHQCNICNKMFHKQESLSLHKRNHHGQTGGGIKRKAVETSGPPIKRRITKYDNPDESYNISVIGEHRMPKFNTTSTRYKIAFKNLDIKGIPNILRSLRLLFNSIIRDITEFMDSSDLVRMSVQCPELDFPVALPFMKLHQLSAERFLTEIERVLQSYEEFVLDETLEIELIHVSLPSGGVGKRCKYVDLEKTLKEKRCFIRIQNNDDLCCARAIVTAKARIDNHEKWNSIRLGKSIQGVMARKLHLTAGVPMQRCGIEDIKAFQRVLEGYQIHVISKRHFNAIIYEGPHAENKIYLYHHDEHFDVITKMPAFLGRNYYCEKCNKGYDHKEKHVCNNVCHNCYKIHDVQEENWKYCEDCNRYFRNTECFDLHKQNSSTGISTCNTNFRCKLCNQSIYTKLHKRPHICGEHYCKVCKDYVLADHQCYMQPVTEDKKADGTQNTSGNERKGSKANRPKTFIFFDFECRQDDILSCEYGYAQSVKGMKCKNCKQSSCGTRKHKPNLCVVHKVCEACLEKNVVAESRCKLCGKNEYIFRGEATRDDFCRWLFSEENYGAKVLCHNFKGYDSYPILQYLYGNAILPEVVVTGSKFMSIDVPQCNIRFLDSINFMPMALEEFPKSFGLDELRKGYFPHLFNTKENQDTVMPYLPDIEYYNPNSMKVDKRRKFENWYEEHKYDSFNFQEELLAYCRSDVDILRKGSLAFRKMFMDVTKKEDLPGIDPFENCITIASACNQVFRRNFLNYESIGIIPSNGYRPEQKQSVKALKWLKYMSYRDHINILHSGNGGEKQIGPFYADGYTEKENGEGIVYEFHGCFWHGCEKCFGRSTINPVTGTSMLDLFQRTMDKRKYIEDKGYTYISIWECDFDRELESDVSMKKFVNELCIIDPLDPREAFYGGRTEAFTLYKESNENNRINYYDVTSLYPFINKTGKIPLGHPTIITENFGDLRTYEGLIKCKVVPPKGLFLPVLPTKCNGKLLFGLCRTCMASNSVDNCLHTDDDRALTGTWVTEEIIKALDKGYRVVEIYEVWHFDQISQYNPVTKSGGIFTDYVNTFLKIKQEASGWPEWCTTLEDQDQYIKEYYEKEGILLTAENIKKNPGLRQLAKLMLNRFELNSILHLNV